MERKQKQFYRYILEAIEEKTPETAYVNLSKMGAHTAQATDQLRQAGYIHGLSTAEALPKITAKGEAYLNQLRSELPKIAFTDLTKVMLQGRRFFRPVDLETRGLRRVLHPYAGVISALGFAVAFAMFLWKDVAIEETKDSVDLVERSLSQWSTANRLDVILGTVDPLARWDKWQQFQDRLENLSKGLPKGIDLTEFQKKKTEIMNRYLEGQAELSKHTDLSEEERDYQWRKLRDKYDDDIETAFVAACHEYEEKMHKHLDFLTTTSYFIYALGLIIGVLGQLVDVEVKPKWEG